MNSRPSPAFGQALIAALPSLRRYAMALTAHAAQADDLVQDCIERALARANTLQDPSRIGAWLRAILYNLYIDELRRKRSRGTQIDAADLADDISFSTPAVDGTDMTDLARATQLLAPDHRQILMLAGVEELSYREMAEELGVPVGTVMSRLARARTALRALLEPAAPAVGPRP